MDSQIVHTKVEVARGAMVLKTDTITQIPNFYDTVFATQQSVGHHHRIATEYRRPGHLPQSLEQYPKFLLETRETISNKNKLILNKI